MAREIAEEYASSLADLTVNSKPLINMLTILAEENVEHAGVIVETVEKHLEKVHADIKLPVLYLVDSIIKNVGGAYTTKFSQSIVNMFTRTFKQVDEKTRSQMFKLRETWHDVFPATKLYQLDVKVHLIDPAWPIQAQPQANIHVNPNFVKKPVATTSIAPATLSEEEEQMRLVLAKKEQELLTLQRKKIELELEQTRRQLEFAEKNAKKSLTVLPPVASVAPVVPLMAPATSIHPVVANPALASLVPPITAEVAALPVKQRLGPPVTKTASARIAPVSGAMLAATRRDPRRDPRLARHTPAPPPPPPPTITPATPNPIAPNVFDIKPLERVTKRKNVITIDVRPDDSREGWARDPRCKKKDVDERRKADKERKNERRKEEKKAKEEEKKKPEETEKIDSNNFDINVNATAKSAKNSVDDYMNRLADPDKINKLPPIPKLSRHDDAKEKKDSPSPVKKRKETARDKKAKKRDGKESSESTSSPEKKNKTRRPKKEQPMDVDKTEEEMVAFKELKNYHKERYRRNNEKADSPDKPVEETVPAQPESETPNIPDVVVENKDVDLRVLHPVVTETKAAQIGQKRSSTEALEGKNKKSKTVFDRLFGNEDVDLRQLPQLDDAPPAPADPAPCPAQEPPPSPKTVTSPVSSPRKDWQEVKDKTPGGEPQKGPSKLDLVRAKLAEATKGKDRLGRPLLFTKSPSLERERRRTISAEDTDLRPETDDEVNKETISLILSQAKEHYKDGKMDKNQYNTLMFQVMQLNEKLKLKEAKQRESLEMSKRKLRAQQELANNPKLSPNEQNSFGNLSPNEHNRFDKLSPKEHNRFGNQSPNEHNRFAKLSPNENNRFGNQSPNEHNRFAKLSPNENNRFGNLSPNEHNRFGDIDERITPALLDTPPTILPPVAAPPDIQDLGIQDSDMRMPPQTEPKVLLPHPPMPPIFLGPYVPPQSMWRGMRPRGDDFAGPRRPRAPIPPFFRAKFDKRGPRPFDSRFVQPVPPKVGVCQGESPVLPYQRSGSPPPLGSPGQTIPPTDFRVLEYVDQDPMKTIEIDGVPREIRFYGETAVIMLDWDDPREIKFLPGARRITFDNKDSVVLNFNDEYQQVEIDDQVFDIRFGAPTRELLINGRWYECFFGAPPTALLIDGKHRMIKLDGPPPQVDIGKEKRTDLVAGKINMIIDAAHMCPVFLDSKVQTFIINGHFYTIRFADALRTVLINDMPFKIEFGGLPRPIFIGPNKHFVRFSVLPRHVRPGFIEIANMEGSMAEPPVATPVVGATDNNVDRAMETDPPEEMPRPEKVSSPDGESNHGGLDMLASLMPSSMAPASGFSGYSLAEPVVPKTEGIPGLETQTEDATPQTTIPALGNLNVNDLFAKLIATGIVQVPAAKEDAKDEKDHAKAKSKEDQTIVHRVDLMRPETLRVKQPALVAKLYGGMQCSGCGARFPPEHTVRYSQHLDWHFRQNRRERDSARRAHSRHWHYDLSDWVQYEEVEDLEEREKSWFETGGAEGEGEAPPEPEEPPSVAAGAFRDQSCALCGDKFHQFYNEDQEEWHLRKAVRHEDKNYHPLCFEDYKASLAKEALPVDDSVVEVPTEDPPAPAEDEPIEIRDEVASQSDNDDVVEVLEDAPPADEQEALEVEDEGEEDDVIYKAEPVEEVVVDDECDTDDETKSERRARDKLADDNMQLVKVKQEPIDPDDEPVITAEEEAIRAKPDSSQTQALVSSIDGNVQLDTAPAPAPVPSVGIRINITKTIPTFLQPPERMLEDISADDEPLPPGEEPELDYKLKPSLEGVQFSRQPPTNKGTELSGLCSIM